MLKLNDGYVFIAWCLVKHKDNFILPYLTLLYSSHCQSIYYITWERMEFGNNSDFIPVQVSY